MHRILSLALATLLAAAPTLAPATARAANVSAAQAEAKEVAKSQGNCTPAKVDVLSYSIGREGQTVFKVGCSEDKEAFVLVQCRSRICTLLR
ncbi:hypothetical protein [Azospirillum doebereinerae]|uniref:hypothetical protein n=1 Tax=Azospirillum doebereinerae TaxID=92933 RepID=UPI00163BBD97|nr:hypothetical protein [Azospirillum doebereinerae]MCG5242847.1 hypothetical protein [Azospirillum doebereinerae]